MRRRFTLINHVHMGNHWYIIEMKRVFCTAERLERYYKERELHFVIFGWPKVTFPDGTDYFSKEVVVRS